MSSRKRSRSPRQRSLRFKLLVFACLLLGPPVIGGACGAVSQLLPTRRSFGNPGQTAQTQPSSAPAYEQSGLTGVVTGAVVGVAACIAYGLASRHKKRPW
jgi:ABC-type Fe3+ transport system permease subunit